MKTHNLIRWVGLATSGRSVYRGTTFWYWQDDMCESDGGDEGYPDMLSAFKAALEHAYLCPHVNAKNRSYQP